MKQEEKKPREFWVYKGTSNFYDELTLDDACENYIRNDPEGFYDIVSEKDTINRAIHVIEYSAYEQLKAKLEKACEALRFYEQVSVWGNGCAAIDPCDTYTCDLNVLRGGKRARAALREIEGE